ncbi:hypothetical protein SBADM41S_00747 [Streptomyces badius]
MLRVVPISRPSNVIRAAVSKPSKTKSVRSCPLSCATSAT